MKKISIIFLLLLSVSSLYAETSFSPPQLMQWKDWILEKHPEIDCPFLGVSAELKRCSWPGALTININSNGAQFTQSWEVFGDSWLALPGNQNHWPVDVTIDGAKVTVLERNKVPSLYVEAGKYNIEGQVSWNERPQFLQIPANNGLVTVYIDNELLTWPNIDNRGFLWFKQSNDDNENLKNDDSVKTEVFRRINDGIPITVDTELRLVVSGKPRELIMGRLQLSDSEATIFHSDLPARIEQNGLLRIQVRAGSWRVRLSSRANTNFSTLKMEQATDDWPSQEIWTFKSAPLTRGVKISGVVGVDPEQLDLPRGWNNLPTYLVEPKDTFTIEEQYRGDVVPAANQLNLDRHVWLDFDGKGVTIKDKVNGVMYQNWRLLAKENLKLGRVSVDGVPQLVTRIEDESSEGVEIRKSELNLEAISRLDDRENLTAVGWQHDINSLHINLNLPPGWMLWHATGTDTVNNSWLSRWDLWDLFLCLLIIGASSKLLSWRWAMLATITLALTYHETNAPLISWVVLIIIIPLLQVLPSGRFRKLITSAAYMTLVGLTIIFLTFAVQQVRKGIYPQLDKQYYSNQSINRIDYNSSRGRSYDDESIVQSETAEFDLYSAATVEQEIIMEDMAASQSEFKSVKKLKSGKPKRQQQRYQPSANTQTGPGEPTWNWKKVNLNWSGPVKADAPLDLYLSPPWLTRILMFLQVILVAALAFGFARAVIQHIKPNIESTIKPDKKPTPPTSSVGVVASLCLSLIISSTLFIPNEAFAEEFPPEYLLQEWEQRLTKAPDCVPHCFSINFVYVTVAGDTLQMRLRVGVGTKLGAAFPYDKTWQSKQVLINGVRTDSVIRSGGKLWIKLPKGNNEVVIEGLVQGDSINIPFLQIPHNVTVDANGWEIFGLEDNRVPGKSLQLQKREKVVEQDTLLPEPISPFVKVHRELLMDLDWNIRTTVVRTAPKQGGITINIPLLDQESVVSENINVIEQGGQRYVAATFGARQNSVSWDSVIKPVPQIQFKASANSQYVEVWSAEASARWHINYEGLTPIKNNDANTRATLRWLPWPGEQLQLEAIKPEPVSGSTTTVENVLIKTKPGTRSTNLELLLTIRTSLGGDFYIEQPENATLEKITIDGVETTQQQEDNIVIIPLHPGLQKVSVNWLLGTGVIFNTKTPTIKLSAPASNIDISMALPHSRWPLFVTGPDIGPAMLYWGVLIVILFVAVALGVAIKRFQLNIPVNTWQWVLLAIGMSTVNMVGSIFVVLWFFALEARTKITLPSKRWQFNLMQLMLIALSVISIACLFVTIPESLLSTPNMQVTGNGSSNYQYMWYQDNSNELLPYGQVYSVPISIYRISMLAWSLWLVFALLRWIKWGWGCFSFDKMWMAKETK